MMLNELYFQHILSKYSYSHPLEVRLWLRVYKLSYITFLLQSICERNFLELYAYNWWIYLPSIHPFEVEARNLATPSIIVTWASWPQVCILLLHLLLCSQSTSSFKWSIQGKKHAREFKMFFIYMWIGLKYGIKLECAMNWESLFQ